MSADHLQDLQCKRASRSMHSQVYVRCPFPDFLLCRFRWRFLFALGRLQDGFGAQHGPNLNPCWSHVGHFLGHFWVSFWHLNLRSPLRRFFVDFWSLETLKIELPPARELNFDKIDVFHFIANFDCKMIVLRIQNRCKFEENLWKKRVSKQVLF